MKKEPTLLTALQVAAGSLNYAMNCQREGDQKDALRYAEKASDAIAQFFLLYDRQVNTKNQASIAGLESPSTSDG